MAATEFNEDAFAKSLAANVKELIEAGAEAKREEIARNLTRTLLNAQQGRIREAVEADRAQAGRKDAEALDEALHEAMNALGNCEALFTGITHMLNTGDGEPMSLSIMGQDVADAAHAKADNASIAASAAQEVA